MPLSTEEGHPDWVSAMDTPQRKGPHTRETKEPPKSPSLLLRWMLMGKVIMKKSSKKHRRTTNKVQGSSVQAARPSDCCGTQVFRRNPGCSDGTGTRPTPALHAPQGTQATQCGMYLDTVPGHSAHDRRPWLPPGLLGPSGLSWHPRCHHPSSCARSLASWPRDHRVRTHAPAAGQDTENRL